MNQTLRAGDIDPSFGSGGYVNVTELLGVSALRPDQKIVTVATLWEGIGVQVYRNLPDGTPDPLFGADGKLIPFPHTGVSFYNVTGCALQSDGKIIVFGHLHGPGNSRKILLARLHEAGEVDTSFGNAGYTLVRLEDTSTDEAQSVAVLPDDRIVMSVWGDIQSGIGYGALVQLAADGTFDPSFGKVGISLDVPPQVHFLSISPQRDGTLLLCGYAGGDSRTMQPVASRYDRGGKPLPSFGDNGHRFFDYLEAYPGTSFWQALSLMTLSDGKLLMAGLVAPPVRNATTWLTRLQADGATDMAFNDGKLVITTTGYMEDKLILQADGKIVMQGEVVAGTQSVIERRMPDGSRDPTFGDGGFVFIDSPADSFISSGASAMLQTDGKLLLCLRVGKTDIGAPEGFVGMLLTRYLL
ncbi:hypothetical protein ACPWR0_13030 [Pandoraea pneumonica]|uniref:hypothetical protein n=1 Tax=Pandoraea pneumonica TaxID=2508299 RepID=UPI003CED8FA2